MVESAVIEAATKGVAGLRPVSPAAHLAERFAAAEVSGPWAVRIREVPFLTMVGLRAMPGSPGDRADSDSSWGVVAVRLWGRCQRRRALHAVAIAR